jgi:hypothetical protein
MKTIVGGVVAAVAVALVPAVPAQADTRPCVTHYEYQRAEWGMSIDRVGQIFDHLGAQAWKDSGWQERQYPACTGGYVSVLFKWNWRRQKWVERDKWAQWY